MPNKKEPHVIAALDTEEAVLHAVFPDGNYGLFHWHLYCVYEKRTELETRAGNYDKAMEYLRIMLHHAKQSDEKIRQYTCGMFDRISEHLTQKYLCPPDIILGKRDYTKPLFEQVHDILMTEKIYAPLRDREDFQALLP